MTMYGVVLLALVAGQGYYESCYDLGGFGGFRRPARRFEFEPLEIDIPIRLRVRRELVRDGFGAPFERGNFAVPLPYGNGGGYGGGYYAGGYAYPPRRRLSGAGIGFIGPNGGAA